MARYLSRFDPLSEWVNEQLVQSIPPAQSIHVSIRGSMSEQSGVRKGYGVALDGGPDLTCPF